MLRLLWWWRYLLLLLGGRLLLLGCPRACMFIICAMVFIIAQTADGSYCGDVVIGCGADGDVWGLPTF